MSLDMQEKKGYPQCHGAYQSRRGIQGVMGHTREEGVSMVSWGIPEKKGCPGCHGAYQRRRVSRVS